MDEDEKASQLVVLQVLPRQKHILKKIGTLKALIVAQALLTVSMVILIVLGLVYEIN